MSETPLGNNTPPDKSKQFVFSDFFGLGKLTEKLNLSKLNMRMTYCMAGSIIFLSVMGGLYLWKSETDTFPTDWDMRGTVIIALFVFFSGLYAKKTPKSKT